MVNLQDILGEAYTPELETAIGAAYIPKENAQGEANRLKRERDEAIEKAKQLERASLSAEEKAQKDVADAIAEAQAVKASSLKMMSRLELHSGLATAGVDLSKHAATLDMLVGDNPDVAKSLAEGIGKIFADAISIGEAKANAMQLQNNSAPGGGTAPPTTDRAYAEKQFKLAQESGNVHDQVYWTRVAQTAEK